MKHVRHSITCLFDLPDEILLCICRYLSSYHILYAFSTPSEPEQRLHRMILDYRTKIKIDGIKKDEYSYLSNLVLDSEAPLRPKSLILNNEHVTCSTDYYFIFTPEDVIQSINLTQLRYFHITIRKLDVNENMGYLETCNILINLLLFNEEQISSLYTINYQIYNGLLLSKSLIFHDNLGNINLALQTIDDLYILLNGLVPNIQTMIIELCQSRIRYIKSILAYMSNLIKLTLSIHDTFDRLFCHGPTFQSILSEYLPHLRYFDYTMTHLTVIQPSVRHLIVERCLNDEKEMSILAHQFPNVKYLKLDLPLDKFSCINCLNILLNRDDNIQNKRFYWTKLIYFSTELFQTHKSIISNEINCMISSFDMYV
ncbi:unnamed protein product [Rotaria sp. Silwood1]|nr:unnamed protein product [Rotaria sp. Silwood1]